MKELVYLTTFSFKIPLTDFIITVNSDTLLVSWIVMMVIWIFCFWCACFLKKIPGRKQNLIEMLIEWFDGLLEESLGGDGRKFLPLIVTLFVFVLICNWLTVIPAVPSPTKDLNTCLGLGLVVFFTAHISAVKKKGFWKYLKSYCEPVWFLLPSNIFSEISKVLSHSFRLFGNIFAGGIVVGMVPLILWRLFKWWGLPINVLSMPVLNVFFGLLLGSIQAFVFSILAVAYISVLREE